MKIAEEKKELEEKKRALLTRKKELEFAIQRAQNLPEVSEVFSSLFFHFVFISFDFISFHLISSFSLLVYHISRLTSLHNHIFESNQSVISGFKERE
jgi:hypothetical protein